MATQLFRIFRGAGGTGAFQDFQSEVSEGMVVLDVVHAIQAKQATDLACRWNCKAGKCGSCSAEINGQPRLMCMTRLNQLPADKPITIEPMRTFPHIKDLVTDVSWNFEVKKKIKAFKPRKPDAPDGTWRMAQADIDRVQEFRKCIECFLCQDVCHVLRDHHKHSEFIGPRFLVHTAALEMHPLDTEDRVAELKQAQGIGYCNITKCCTKVCPESITITDNAIIPLKERVVDRFYDPISRLLRVFAGSVLVAAVLSAAALAQAPALNVKTGLWQMSLMADMAAASGTADLSKMTPAQRAQWETMMRGSKPTPMTFKNCLTKEKLAEHRFTAERAGQTCRQTVIKATATTLDLNQVCTGAQPSTNDIHVEAVSPSDLKVQVNQTAGRGAPLSVAMTGKWIGADCGDVK